jgi:hypothetical protein
VISTLRLLRHALRRLGDAVESLEARVSMAIVRREADDRSREWARRELERVTAEVRRDGGGW